MDLFTVDTVGEVDLLTNEDSANVEESSSEEQSNSDDESSNDNVENEDDDCEDNYDYGGIPPPSVDIIKILKNPTLYTKPLYDDSPADDKGESDLDAFCRAMGWTNLDGVLPKKPNTKPKRHWEQEIDLNDVHKDLTKTDVDKEMRSSTLKGIEKKRDVKVLREREALRKRKEERSKTKGKHWYDMPATEITDELRQDMEIIQMRSVLNPTHFYKKNDLKTLPKFFQVGTVLPSPLEKQREPGVRVSKKRTLVDELLADAEFQQYNKRKYNEIMAEKKRTGFKKAYKKMKKLKKKS